MLQPALTTCVGLKMHQPAVHGRLKYAPLLSEWTCVRPALVGLTGGPILLGDLQGYGLLVFVMSQAVWQWKFWQGYVFWGSRTVCMLGGRLVDHTGRAMVGHSVPGVLDSWSSTVSSK